MYAIDYPAIVEIFIEHLRKIAEFDFIDAQEIMLWMGYKVNKDDGEGKESAGFPTRDFILNYSLYIIIVALSLFALVISALISLIKKYKAKINY